MTNHFLQTLQHLRHYEELMLYDSLLSVPGQQLQEAEAYLAAAYEDECVTYPFSAPAFNRSAALWAAKTVYTASQLMLYRKNGEHEIRMLLPSFEESITPPAILSADITLRFLPPVVKHLAAVNPEDKLIKILEAHLKTWHYSGVSYPLPVDELSFEVVISNRCLYQLYIDRVIGYKMLQLAKHPLLIGGINASLGIFTDVYWKNFM